MKIIPILLMLGMLAVSGWAERYSPELVQKAEAGGSRGDMIRQHYQKAGRSEAAKFWGTRVG